MTPVVQGSNTCTTCTCAGCTARCSCPSYIDKTITPPPQNWLLSQLFLSTGSSPVISFHPRLHACIPVSFSRRARHSLVVDHTFTLFEIAVLECESRIKSDDSLPDVYLLSLLSFFVFLCLSVCEASRLRSPPFPHSVYVATRSFQ